MKVTYFSRCIISGSYNNWCSYFTSSYVCLIVNIGGSRLKCVVPVGANGIGGCVGPEEYSGEHKTLLPLLGIKPLTILSVA
jgi:hypothetical protein